jgi:hypothetical protein
MVFGAGFRGATQEKRRGNEKIEAISALSCRTSPGATSRGCVVVRLGACLRKLQNIALS